MRRLERAAALDAPGRAIGRAVRSQLRTGTVKDLISGTWLGNSPHPPPVDAVIGPLLSASVLDLLSSESRAGSRRLLQVGLAAAVATLFTGLNDWGDAQPASASVRRVGLLQAGGTMSALALGHTAFIVERGMDGFESGERYDTMGLRGNDLRQLYFNDLRIPPENVLGEPGDGFRIAMEILNNGRMSLGTGSVGLAKRLLDLTIEHVTECHQFGRPLADFDMVEGKIGWMVSYLFGLEAMAYLTTAGARRFVCAASKNPRRTRANE